MEQPPPIFRFSTRKQGHAATGSSQADATANLLISYGNCGVWWRVLHNSVNIVAYPTVAHHAMSHRTPPRIILVLQGGGALGAYQAGVYEALHEAGLKPDWVIGTSIGAINGSLIAGNRPDRRLDRLKAFW